MKKYNIFIIQIVAFLFANSIIAQNKAIHSKGNLVKISQRLTQLQNVDESTLYSIYDKNGRKIWPKNVVKPKDISQTNQSNNSFNNNLVQNEVSSLRTTSSNHIIQGFEGLATGAQPMDPTIAVGTDYVIELVNAVPTSKMRIWDKSGNVLINQITLQAISGFPGFGDPIALYDSTNDRYIVTEFMIKDNNNSTENGLIIMVSANSDPTGQWYVYKWTINENLTLDYPKWAVNSDGIFVHTNKWTQTNPSEFRGSFFIAFNKTQMYSGNSTFDAVRIEQTISDTWATCPAQPQGNFSSSNNQIFVTKNNNSIVLIETPVDWTTNPISFTQNQIASIGITQYSENICQNPPCIEQNNSSFNLPALNNRIMNQPILREFNNYTGIVLSFTVNANNKAGIRWVELMKNGNQWQLKQESTWHISSEHQFVPSIAYDRYGSIALAYNSSSSHSYPSIKYTGRYATDPLNQMSLSENTLKDGNAACLSYRWGDYNHIVADPDGNSFWMVAMYGKSGGPHGTGTYISNFTLNSCPPDLVIKQDVFGFPDYQKAQCTITAINTIHNNSTAAYDAGLAVYLKPNFHAIHGSNFRAFIEGCGECKKSNDEIFEKSYSKEIKINQSVNHKEHITIFPNPTKGILSIKTTKEVESWKITNVYGNSFFKGKSTKNIDISNLPKGIYVLKAILNNRKVVIKRIIKE